MKVDASTFGKPKFEWVHQALADFIKTTKFPLVSSNMDLPKDILFDGLFNTEVSYTPEGGDRYTGKLVFSD